MEEHILMKTQWEDVISEMGENSQAKIHHAIVKYETDGTLVSLKGATRLVFLIIKAEIDEYKALKDAALLKSEKQRENVKKRWGKKSGIYENDTKVIPAEKVVYTKTIPAKNTEKAEKSENAESFQDASSRACVVVNNNNNNQEDNINQDNNNHDIILNQNKKIEKESQKKENEKVDFEAFAKFFNETMEAAGAQIPHNVRMTKKREAAIHARVHEHGKNALMYVVQKAAKSGFLNGGGNHAFVATLDWLLKPNNFVKVLEGNYDDAVNGVVTVPAAAAGITGISNLTSTGYAGYNRNYQQLPGADRQRIEGMRAAAELWQEYDPSKAEPGHEEEIERLLAGVHAG